ncbi:MAG: hypothetical protein JXA13_13665 [Anaerolineales bacterium]|nr:hypothetical protein [Anaerolineales bacterium]
MRAPVTHMLPLTSIVRERLLPIPGEVHVKLNQTVSPGDVIAEAHFAREHILLEVARKLEVSNQAADRLIRCKVGERLQKDALVAEKKGLIPKRITAPQPGRVVAAGGGQVLLELGESTIELKASLPGKITQVIPERGAVIQATGALIQGIWGNGRIDTGLMLSLIEEPDAVITPDRLDVSLRGSIILAGQCYDGQVLQAAAELPARGLILSSLPPSLLPLAIQMRYPIIVIDGFSRLPMNQTAYKILSTNTKREVSINAERMDRRTGKRPEIVIPLPVSQQPPEPRSIDTLAPGQQVRMRRAPHSGVVGILENIRPGLSTLPSGLRVPAAEVKLENNEQILVPLVNLEIIG